MVYLFIYCGFWYAINHYNSQDFFCRPGTNFCTHGVIVPTENEWIKAQNKNHLKSHTTEVTPICIQTNILSYILLTIFLYAFFYPFVFFNNIMWTYFHININRHHPFQVYSIIYLINYSISCDIPLSFPILYFK